MESKIFNYDTIDMNLLRKSLPVALVIVAGLAGAGLNSCESTGGGGGGSMSTLIDSVSYAVGMNIGKGLSQPQGEDTVEWNRDLLLAGLKDGMSGNEGRITDSIAQMAIASFQQEMMSKAEERRSQKAETNKAAGDQFLAENKSKPGVKTTPSGLQYIVVEEGSGESPDTNDMVTAAYRGTLIDGTEFDKSPEGQPRQFAVNQVIPGWTEALQMMKPGAKWKLFVPSDLAYGAGGPPQIGPNSTLIFEIELVDVEKK